jgi:hypothetical protein
LVTVGWHERIVTVVVVLNVSTEVYAPAAALRAKAPRATTRIEARIVDDDDWALEKCS